MQMFLGVKNFAKIEEAKICINNYTLLVGQNNSGKTFLMQLVQGVNQKLLSLVDEDIINILFEKSDNYDAYMIGKHNIANIIEYFNNKLDILKEKIIYEIFGKNIEIEKLYIDLVLDQDDCYKIEILDAETLNYEMKENGEDSNFSFLEPLISDWQPGVMFSVLSKISTSSERNIICVTISVAKREGRLEFLRSAFRNIMSQSSLFLPASRTGLLHLYRDYFANRADDAVSFKIMDDKVIENKEENAGLTKPMYEFLRFLQTYSEDEDAKKNYMEELRFFEERIIEGHISVNKQGVFSYNFQDEQSGVPMYLASSMINEVAPMALVLSNARRYDCLIIDEIEASLHPEKQLELVRFLNRLNNKKMKLIVSTHSDTFVSKVNNLFLLSKRLSAKSQEQKCDIMQKFGLNKGDLIKVEDLFVYEFVNQSNGKSIVKEIIPNENGYQFDLFTSSALQLYEEAIKLGEIQ